MRLIDADALMADIQTTIEESGCVNHEGEILDCIAYADEIDAMLVVLPELRDEDGGHAMENLITEARELCKYSEKIVNQLHTERLDYELEYMPLIETIQVISELCDALEKAQEQNKQLLHEVCKLASGKRRAG